MKRSKKLLRRKQLSPISRPCPKATEEGSVAQLVEQGIEDPRVGGSNPSRATTSVSTVCGIPPIRLSGWVLLSRVGPCALSRPSGALLLAFACDPLNQNRRLQLRSAGMLSAGEPLFAAQAVLSLVPPMTRLQRSSGGRSIPWHQLVIAALGGHVYEAWILGSTMASARCWRQVESEDRSAEASTPTCADKALAHRHSGRVGVGGFSRLVLARHRGRTSCFHCGSGSQN